jgi:hypothetical protein
MKMKILLVNMAFQLKRDWSTGTELGIIPEIENA